MGDQAKKLMVIDDDVVDARFVLRAFSETGSSLDVTHVDDAEAASDRLETEQFDYILLDINMPEPDGFAVQKALRDRAIGLPVIMMSGSGDLTVLALKAGVTDFMQKPFGRGELLSVLEQLDA